MAIAGIHKNSQTPSKQNLLQRRKKEGTQEISQVTIAVEHVICCLKRFKITSDRYAKRKENALN
jgi:hypothetical protein